MNQTVPEPTAEACNPLPEDGNMLPVYYKCLSCEDLGGKCNGPSLQSLGDINAVRNYHRALRKARGILAKTVAKAAPHVSESTINEYFANGDRDYKWTTLSQIDHALLSICGNRVGLPPLVHACPASSADVRQQIAAAELKVAAAELRAAQSESTVSDLQAEIIAVKQRSAERIDQIQADHVSSMTWIRKQIFLWQCLTFSLILVLIVILLIHAH